MTPPTVGVIANPASGRDIRRLVAHASVVAAGEKVRIVRRLLLALDAAGVPRVLYMPDASHLVPRAARDQTLRLSLEPVDGAFHDAPSDTAVAARAMARAGVACCLTLGGDGTNRAFTLGTTEIPLIPLSTGTNNVFPGWRESTVAGLAAAAIALGAADPSRVAPRAKIVQVEYDHDPTPDLALIDAAMLHGDIVGSRAIWQPDRLRRAVLTRAHPAAVGLAAIGGAVATVTAADDHGLHLVFQSTGPAQGSARHRVRAAFAPGLIRDFSLSQVQALPLAAIVPLTGPALLAFDGEREGVLRAGQSARLQVLRAGPPVVDIDACLAGARDAGFFAAAAPSAAPPPRNT